MLRSCRERFNFSVRLFRGRNLVVSVVKSVIVCVKVYSVFLTVVFFLGMDIVRRILACETIDELAALEGLYVLSEYEQGLVYERRIEIVSRLLEWGTENEQQGLVANLSDSWTPEQRRSFLVEWNDDEPFRAVMNSEPVVQSGHGEKRTADESGEGTSEQVSESNYFTVTNVKQVKVKKFRTTDVFMKYSQVYCRKWSGMYLKMIRFVLCCSRPSSTVLFPFPFCMPLGLRQSEFWLKVSVLCNQIMNFV